MNYKNPDEAEKAVKNLNGLRLQNKTIKVSDFLALRFAFIFCSSMVFYPSNLIIMCLGFKQARPYKQNKPVFGRINSLCFSVFSLRKRSCIKSVKISGYVVGPFVSVRMNYKDIKKKHKPGLRLDF